MAVPTTMKEYRIADGLNKLSLTSSPVPQLKATEVLVKIHAVSLNYRDLLTVDGNSLSATKKYIIPGSDTAGEIVALGAEVAGWTAGERVCANFTSDHIFGEANNVIIKSVLSGGVDGVLMEYRALPAHSLVRIPEHLSYEEGSTLPCAAVTAYNCLMGSSPIKGGDVVLVQGTGGVSIFGLQLAVASGAVVIATSSSDEKLKVAKTSGAVHLINYKTTPDWDAEVMKVTGGEGVKHAIDVGGNDTVLKSLNCTAWGGVVNLVGILGITIGSRTQFEDMNRLISAAKIKPLVDKVFDFEHVADAYDHPRSQKHVGKVVIKVSA
ncbi:NAD-P-binding protein [Epithele typhae]|uniref:NAD-P-binding protein n=1 Tax=Epithele typhae TaxID=378194 RepID=UPI002008B3B6|nr:NAD-P-binding protein [Epithele typhae]KAH9920831.1 NAD-P-binding protein [Epithele typhae]